MTRPGQFLPGNKFGKGRPKRGSALADILRFKLKQDVSEEDRRSMAEAWADDFIAMARTDASAAKALMDRIDGPIVLQPGQVPDGATLRRVIIEEVRYDNGESAATLDAGERYVEVSLSPRPDADVEQT